MKDNKPFIKVFFTAPDGQEQLAGIILMGEFGSGFAYHNDYTGPALDPINLDYRRQSSRKFPLVPNNGRLHGVFEDCLPDGFAHRMLCHDEPEYARKTDVERMFWLNTRTHGPFRFQSMSSIDSESPIRGDKKLEEIRKRVVAFHLNESDFDGQKVMNKFNRFALTYDGGTHPKCLYEHVDVSAGQGGARHHQRTRWVAKFNVDSQVTNGARVEATMLDLSAACGINTPEVRIKTLPQSREDVLMVRRFDEVDTADGVRPLHKLSLTSLTGIDNKGASRARTGDFADILAAVKRCSVNPVEDTEELFRRMLFHVAINNADNHFKNFEMLLTETGWRLAPSFDTLPHEALPGTEPFSTTIFGEAFPQLSQQFVFEQGRNFGLSRHRAAALAAQIFEGCTKVEHHMDRFGVSPEDRARIGRAMPLPTLRQLAAAFGRISEHEAANSLFLDEPARVEQGTVVRWRLNDTDYELLAHRIPNVTELKARMAQGALLYWTMVRPAHALLLEPQARTVSQLAFFKPLWGLQRSKQIRHERYEGIYQVFVPTNPTRELAGVGQMIADFPGPQRTPAAGAGDEPPRFEPSI